MHFVFHQCFQEVEHCRIFEQFSESEQYLCNHLTLLLYLKKQFRLDGYPGYVFSITVKTFCKITENSVFCMNIFTAFAQAIGNITSMNVCFLTQSFGQVENLLIC